MKNIIYKLGLLVLTVMVAAGLLLPVGVKAENTENPINKLVSFEFVNPAQRVLLDGKPLTIIADTLTANIVFYDSTGNLVEEEIAYSTYLSGKRGRGTWQDLSSLYFSTNISLYPSYDASAGNWYYDFDGDKKVIPMHDLEVTSDEIHSIDKDTIVGGESRQNECRIYQLDSEITTMWTQTFSADNPGVYCRSTKEGDCIFPDVSSRPEEMFKSCVAAGEACYFCVVDCSDSKYTPFRLEPMVSDAYKGVADKEYYCDVFSSSVNSDYFVVSAHVQEAGWYRLRYGSKLGFSGTPEMGETYASRYIASRFWEQNLSYCDTHGSNSSTLFYLEPGTVFFQNYAWVNSTYGSYSDASMKIYLQPVAQEEITKLGLTVYADYQNETSRDFRKDGSYGDLYYVPNYYTSFSPADLYGKDGVDFLRLSFRWHFSYTDSGVERVENPAFGMTDLPLHEMTLVSDSMLEWDNILDGKITVQLLAPDGTPLSWLDENRLKEGDYTILISDYAGDQLQQTAEIGLHLPLKEDREILSPEDFSLDYAVEDPAVYQYEQLSEDAWTLTLHNRYSLSVMDELLYRLDIPCSYRLTRTQYDFTETPVKVTEEVQTVTETLSPISIEGDEVELIDQRLYLNPQEQSHSDYLEFHLSNQETGEEITDYEGAVLDEGTYLLAITSRRGQFQKTLSIIIPEKDIPDDPDDPDEPDDPDTPDDPDDPDEPDAPAFENVDLVWDDVVINYAMEYLDAEEEYFVYDGTPKELRPESVYDAVNGVFLEEGTDYTLKYVNNIHSGWAGMVMEGQGRYYGKRIDWYWIAPAKPEITVKAKTGLKYNGKEKLPNDLVTVRVKGDNRYWDYLISTNRNFTKGATLKNAGTYYVKVFAEATNDFQDGESNIVAVTIGKATQKLSGVLTKKSLKYNKLKKKAQTFKISAKAKENAKLTFKKKSGNSKIKVSSVGKVTVAKGLKKGTYKVKVGISAKATKNYNKLNAKVYTLTITVK